MYNVSGALEVGNAQELILDEIKKVLVFDDDQPFSDQAEEYFDE
jgi:hypothetical protein